MRKIKPLKLLPVWTAIIAVLVIAGTILIALLGLNNSPAHLENNTVEVTYNIAVANDEKKVESLEGICKDVFKEKGLRVLEEREGAGLSSSQDMSRHTYIFSASISRDTFLEVKSSIETKVAEVFQGEGHLYDDIDIALHSATADAFTEPVWRGAIAIAVGVIVALLYVGIRFGIGCALTGLTAAAAGGVLPVCVLGIARVPVFPVASVFYAAIGAFVTLLLWLIQCMKLRDIKKENSRPLQAEEAVEAAYKGAIPATAALLIALAAVIGVIGAVASAGVRTLVLPALLSLCGAAFATLLFAPALHVPVKTAFDRIAARRRPRYSGKKSEKAKSEE